MSTQSAKIYAKAFFEAASEARAVPAVLAVLKDFNVMCAGNPALRSIFLYSAVNSEKRARVLEALLTEQKTAPLPAKMLLLLSRRGRVAELGEIIAGYERLVDASEGVLRGELKSAISLPEEEVQTLSGALAKTVGRGVRLEQKVDPALLGGFVATVAGRTFDASLRTQLERLRNSLA